MSYKKMILICLVTTLLLLVADNSFSTDETLETKSGRIVRDLTAGLKRTDFEKISQCSLTWTVYMDGKYNITMIMDATMKMERTKNGFAATFTLTEPEGRNAWSWLMLNLFGKYTETYKQMLKSVELVVQENFHLEKGRLKTDLLEEFLPPVKQYENQTAIKIGFDYDTEKIKFWKDKTEQESFYEMPFTGQTGPFTAFFNYVFINPPETDMVLINALKDVPDQKENERSFDKREVTFLFESEEIHLSYNKTGLHNKYGMVVSLEKGNLFDVIYGENIFYQVPDIRKETVQIPYNIRIEGFISRSKKKDKLKDLKKRYPGRIIKDEDIFREVEDILAVKNVRMYLTKYEIVKTQ